MFKASENECMSSTYVISFSIDAFAVKYSCRKWKIIEFEFEFGFTVEL